MKQTPLLFLSDSPSLQTGLSRIGRGLACLAAECPEFRVGYLGRGGVSSRQIPVHQYTFGESDGFGNDALIEHVWKDFSRDGDGIIFVIGDASRYRWLARGQWQSKRRDKLELWTYVPVDAITPSGGLSPIERDALQGYNRILAYGPFGANALSLTMQTEIDWIPHGMSTNVFQPRDKVAARIAMQFDERDKVVGCVMTNQTRKDWGVAIKTLSLLPSEWKLWAHVDVLERHWSLPALIEEYGVSDRIKLTMAGDMNDTEMSYGYSATDVTILPSSEGFGFPIAESLSCGVPVVHSTYAGGNWQLPTVRYVVPDGFHVEGQFNAQRPIFDPQNFVDAVIGFKQKPEDCRTSVAHLAWKPLWDSCWKKWFLKGIAK